MPAKTINELPAAFKKQPDAVKRKALPVFNALLKKGMPEGQAIRIALTKAREADMKDTELKQFHIAEQMKIVEAVGETGTVWEVRCIAPGMSLNKTFYPEAVLQEVVAEFDKAPCYADHSDESRSVRDVVGWFESPRYVDGSGVHAEFHALESTEWFLRPFREAYSRGNRDLIGFSISGEGMRHPERIDGQLAYMVDKIRAIESVDAVINPSAGGRVEKLVASQAGDEEVNELMKLEDMTLDELKAVRPDLVGEATSEVGAQLEELSKAEKAKADADAENEKAKKAKDAKAKAKAEEQAKAEASEKERLAEQAAKADTANAAIEELKEQALSEVASIRQEVAIAKSERILRATLEECGLPNVLRDKLLRRFEGSVFTEEDLTSAIEDEETTLKALQDERPTSYPRVEMGESERDKAMKALEGLFAGEDIDGVPAARTLREAYAVFKGYGVEQALSVDASEVLRESYAPRWSENAPDSLREQVTGNAYGQSGSSWDLAMNNLIHKRLLAEWRLPWLEEWKNIVSSIVAVPDFKVQRRVRIGGYGNWVSVAEDATYAAISTPTNEEATYYVTKYGNTEALTLEAIANDDIGAIRRIPTGLARGGKTLLYETVVNLIRDNAATTYDGTAIFNISNHANALTTGSFTQNLSDANLSKAKKLLVEQTEKDSSKPLGLRAKLLVVPPELEATAMRLQQNEFAMAMVGPAESGTPADRYRDINVHKNTFQYLMVPHWTGANRWYLLADPRLYPTIEVGFYQGRQEPELFVQDMPNVGSVFDRDKVTYKGRLIFGTCVLDHRAKVCSNEHTA